MTTIPINTLSYSSRSEPWKQTHFLLHKDFIIYCCWQPQNIHYFPNQTVFILTASLWIFEGCGNFPLYLETALLHSLTQALHVTPVLTTRTAQLRNGTFPHQCHEPTGSTLVVVHPYCDMIRSPNHKATSQAVASDKRLGFPSTRSFSHSFIPKEWTVMSEE